MDKWPQPFWACILALQGAILAVVCLFAPSRENILLAALAIASNLVSGALGAFAGHASALARRASDGGPTLALPPTQPGADPASNMTNAKP